MKLAIVHDHLTQDGGAERVVKIFQEVFPEAPTFVLVHDKKEASSDFLNKDIRTTFLQKMPLGVKKHEWYLPLMPHAVETHDLSDYDVVLSSSSMFAKGVITKPEALHICYCHTPTRFLWNYSNQYVKELKYPNIVKKLIPFVLPRIRVWDKMSSERVDHFIANSNTVKKRIAKYYSRNSDVLYPPVDTHKYYLSEKKGNYFLAGGRLVSYKRFDLTVKAFSRIGIPLKIFGEGPELEELKKNARYNIEFLGKISEEEKIKLYSEALAYIHPQEEDFGISAVEAMAAGTPVIAFGKGGALETVKNGETGEFFKDQSWEEIADHVIRFDTQKYNSYRIREHAEKFSANRFKTDLTDFINKRWEQFNNNL